MDSETKATLKARLTDYQNKYTEISAALDDALTNAEFQTHSFTDPEGSQSVTRRTPAELMEILRSIEIQIDYLTARLNGTGLHCANLRRF